MYLWWKLIEIIIANGSIFSYFRFFSFSPIRFMVLLFHQCRQLTHTNLEFIDFAYCRKQKAIVIPGKS